MSRLAKRGERLEGGDKGGIDIVAKVPDAWSEERQSAEVEAVAKAQGADLPFGLVVMVARGNEAEGARLLFMGKLGGENVARP